MQLKDKIALVTGSSTGIGEQIARRFAREGARVMVHGLDEGETAAVAKAIEADGGQAAWAVHDLAEPQACEALVAATVEAFGGLNILVNNAAFNARSNLETTDAALFDRVVAVNLRAPLLLIRAARPHFLRAGGAAVLNIGSVNAHGGARHLLAYAISKGGLMTMTRNLADAHGHERIRINQLNPGWVLTDNEYQRIVKEGLPADWPQRVSPIDAPAGRLLTPEEIAHMALAFVCDEAALISGSVVELEQFSLIGRNPPKAMP